MIELDEVIELDNEEGDLLGSWRVGRRFDNDEPKGLRQAEGTGSQI